MRILFALCTIAAWGGSARAYTVVTTAAGQTAHWNLTVVHVAIDADAPSRQLSLEDAQQALAQAAAAWSDSSVTIEVDPPAHAGDDSVNLVRFHVDDWPYDQRMLAYTQLYARPDTGEITQAVVDVDERDHHFGTDGGKAVFDLQAVLTHELGHVLGLGHSDDAQATMFAGTAPGDVHQRLPDADDRAGASVVEAARMETQMAGCSMSRMSRAQSGGAATLLLLVGIGLLYWLGRSWRI
jgi:hypothetical protein